MWISDCGVPSILKTVPGCQVRGHSVLKWIFQHGVVFHAVPVRNVRVGSFRRFPEKANKSILTTYIFQLAISSDKNIWSIFPIYSPHHKLYVRNFLPINNTVQHIFNGKIYIFNDTAYLLSHLTFRRTDSSCSMTAYEEVHHMRFRFSDFLTRFKLYFPR